MRKLVFAMALVGAGACGRSHDGPPAQGSTGGVGGTPSVGGTAGSNASGTGGSTAGGGGSGTSGTTGSSGTAGNPMGGTGGTVPGTFPTCLTDLMAECVPDEPCFQEAPGVVCFRSGATVATEPVEGGCDGSYQQSYYRDDGSLCLRHTVARYMGHACEIQANFWSDGDGTTIATGDIPACVDVPTVLCDPTSTRCASPPTACTSGSCAPGQGGHGGEAGAGS